MYDSHCAVHRTLFRAQTTCLFLAESGAITGPCGIAKAVSAVVDQVWLVRSPPSDSGTPTIVSCPGETHSRHAPEVKYRGIGVRGEVSNTRGVSGTSATITPANANPRTTSANPGQRSISCGYRTALSSPSAS